jgi:crotonobetainyl-CoA:carnitine CoA-transferase CaiB-like acyl-CoA transferase
MKSSLHESQRVDGARPDVAAAPGTVPSPLEGVVVADLTGGVAGQYAGRMLAMHGATVILVEPPAGTPTRRMPPSPPDGGDSYLFRHLNQGKSSVVVQADRADDQELLSRLLHRADVVLRDQDADPPAALGDTTVDCEIGDFPPDGPYRSWGGVELVHQALSGVMNATGQAGREPIYGVGHRSSYATGTTAYISVLSALHERRRSGRGQRVRATVFESLAAMGQNLVSQFSYNGTHETRARYPGFLAVLRCRDAWVVLFAIRNWPTLCRVFDLEELLADPRFTTSGDRLANWPIVVELLQGRASGMLAEDVVTACQAGRVSAEKISDLAELVGSEQWRVRRMLAEAPAPGRRETALDRLFDIEDVRTGVRSASPGLGTGRAEAAAAGGER